MHQACPQRNSIGCGRFKNIIKPKTLVRKRNLRVIARETLLDTDSAASYAQYILSKEFNHTQEAVENLLEANAALKSQLDEASKSTLAATLTKLSSTTASSHCVLQHPGAVCCTSTFQAEEQDHVSLTIHTTAKRMNDTANKALPLGIEDLSALAALALAETATTLAASREQSTPTAALAPEHLSRHAAITDILEHGEIIKVLDIGRSQFNHPRFTVIVQDPKTGRRIKALFKPRVYNDAEGWHCTKYEVAAYHLNLLLGLDMVPPAVYRKTSTVIPCPEGEMSFEEGALMYWSESTKELRQVSESEWGISKEALLSNTRILDVLLHNSDRHHGHFLHGRHWVNGHWEGRRWVGDLSPVLIDHAASFRRGAYVCLDHENCFCTGPVRSVEARTFLRLRYLDGAVYASKVVETVAGADIREMLYRQREVLRYFDRLVMERGFEKTVLSSSTYH